MSGPLAPGIQYLRDLGWIVEKRDSWSTPFGTPHVDLDDPWLVRKFGELIQKSIQQNRCEEGLRSVSSGPIAWTIARRAAKKKPTNLRFMQAIWQGAILHDQNGGPAKCQVCGQDNSLRHILWECSRWQGDRKFRSHLKEMATRYPAEVLWLRGFPLAWPSILSFPRQRVKQLYQVSGHRKVASFTALTQVEGQKLRMPETGRLVGRR